MEAPLIEFRNVTKRFGSNTVLEDVNLKIYEGEVTTIIGLSGTGKSVLLKHIIGLLKPDEGAILFRGVALNEMKSSEKSSYFAQMSYMFQGNALFDSMTVFENIAMPLLETTNLSKAEIDRRVRTRLEQAELTDAADKYPSEISGGMQKRVALARALVTDPRIVLFDEPTTGQDPVRKNVILSMVAEYHRRFGFTAIMVSHAIPDVYYISNRILALYDRRIVFQGTPEELEEFDHPFKDEVIRSLEGLRDELTGFYSKRQFKIRYQAELKGRTEKEKFVLIFFTLGQLERITDGFGYETAQEMIRCFGAYIEKHFGATGGFSTRLDNHEFITILPFSDLEESQGLLDDFIKDFREHGACDTLSCSLRNPQFGASIDLLILAGIAQGQTGSQIDNVLETARKQLREIARIPCGQTNM